MNDEIEVCRLDQREKQECESILRSLPGWFGIEDALRAYAEDIATMETFGARRDGDLLGFATWKPHFDHAAEIYIMAVREANHRQGIGRRLMQVVEECLRERGVRWVQVKTLGPSHPDEATRARAHSTKRSVSSTWRSPTRAGRAIRAFR